MYASRDRNFDGYAVGEINQIERDFYGSIKRYLDEVKTYTNFPEFKVLVDWNSFLKCDADGDRGQTVSVLNERVVNDVLQTLRNVGHESGVAKCTMQDHFKEFVRGIIVIGKYPSFRSVIGKVREISTKFQSSNEFIGHKRIHDTRIHWKRSIHSAARWKIYQLRI